MNSTKSKKDIYCMKKLIYILLINLLTVPAFTQHARKLSRAESFWGLHFDRHANESFNHIGATLTEGMIDSMLLMARPDYIQIDCKGHEGVSSYQTAVGKQAAGYDKDPLALFRKVTDKHNVGLYVHYSGVWDFNYARVNPSEARVKEDGTPDDRSISFWGNYADNLLIPQLKEIALKYKIDGVWIDGECWAVDPDYRPDALKEFAAETGITDIPRLPKDPGYKELLDFTRRKFVSYLDYYSKEVHKDAPDFRICSNWAYSALMPEAIPEGLQLDYLSGDYDPDDAMNTANWNSRCLAEQGKPYDLLAWSFVRHMVPKTAVQLCQEAAAVISMGGGCSIYFRQNDDMSPQPAAFPIMKDIADFMIPRKEFCKGIKPLPQIGLFYSEKGWKNEVDAVYRPAGVNGIRGVMNALLDGQQAVEVLMTHHLEKRMDEFPLIVVPEWKVMEPHIINRLKEYVKEGGNLLIIGVDATTHFYDILDVSEIKKGYAEKLGYGPGFIDVHSPYRIVSCNSGAKEFAKIYAANDFRFSDGIAATISNYGKGKVAGVYFDMGENYLTTTSPVFRDFLSGIVAKLFPDPVIRTKGTHRLNVVPTVKNGKMLVQLVNTSGDHANRNVKGIDEIPALRNISVSILTGNRPEEIILQPENVKLDFTFSEKDKRASVLIPEIEIHNILEVVN